MGVEEVVDDDADEEVVGDDADEELVATEEVVEGLEAAESEGVVELVLAPLPPLLRTLAFLGSSLAIRTTRLVAGWNSNESCSRLFAMLKATVLSVAITCDEFFTLRKFTGVALLRGRVSIAVGADGTGTSIAKPVVTGTGWISTCDKTNLVGG